MDIAALMSGGSLPTTAAMSAGSAGALQMPSNMHSAGSLPTAEDLADVSFSPTFYGQYASDQREQGQGSRQWR